MSRAFLFVLDSFGIGGAPDAKAFGDEGSNTLGHIVEACSAGRGDRAGLRSGPLNLPNMSALGLFHAANLASDLPLPRSRSLRPDYGVQRKKYLTARIRRPGIGRLPAYRSHSTGAISRRKSLHFPTVSLQVP